MTWEPASALPQSLIDEFENGKVRVQNDVTETRFGVVNHTLTVDVCHAPEAKKQKTAHISLDTGYMLCCLSTFAMLSSQQTLVFTFS